MAEKLNYKEYTQSSKWLKILKNNVINIHGDDIIFEIKHSENDFELTISKNKEVAFFTLKREFAKSHLVNHNGLDDPNEKTFLNANLDKEYEFRIWVIPLEYLNDIINLLENNINLKVKAITPNLNYQRALKDILKQNIETWLYNVFNYETLKILLGEYETKFYEKNLKNQLDKFYDDLDLDKIYVEYYNNTKKQLIDLMENDPTYKEIETFNIDDNGVEQYEWKSQYPEFVNKVLELKDLEIYVDNISEYVVLEKQVLDLYNQINKFRDEYYEKLKLSKSS